MAQKIFTRRANYSTTDRTGLNINPGPFLAVVKNNLDPTRAGRLQVYLPDLGGIDPDDPTNWFTVRYISPFRGQTIPDKKWTIEHAQTINPPPYGGENGMQSYGMWFTPPDIGIKVLVVFANGDPSQGYYLGALVDSFDGQMTPGIGAGTGYAAQWNPGSTPTQAALKPYIQLPSGEIPFRLPLTEAPYDTQTGDQFATLKRWPHIYQSAVLGRQGLAFDFIRGTTSASSTRESPSQVFGISTPGRLYPFKDTAESKKTLDAIDVALASGNPPPADLDAKMKDVNRIGGHTFIMDDGTVQGFDAGIRIRSSNGNMVLLDDTNGQVYIVNAKGTAWIEMSPSGRIDVYSQNDFSVRSEGNINFHADKDINMHAGGRINQFAANSIWIESQGKISLNSKTQINAWGESSVTVGTKGQLILSAEGQASMKAGNDVIVKGANIQLNSSDGAPNAEKPNAIEQKEHVKVSQVGQAWWANGEKFKSIVKIAPAHEPWPTHEVNGIKTILPAGNATPTPTPQTYAGQPPAEKIDKGTVANQPDPGEGVCGLTKEQTKVMLAKIAAKESGGYADPYKVVNPIGFAGKYQFGKLALETHGYLKQGSSKKGTNKKVMEDPNNWTGKDGIKSQADFLNNPDVQEKVMIANLKMNCGVLRKMGHITSTTPAEKSAGLLASSHLVGAGGAAEFASGSGNPIDGNGTSAGSYYAAVSQAVSKLG